MKPSTPPATHTPTRYLWRVGRANRATPNSPGLGSGSRAAARAPAGRVHSVMAPFETRPLPRAAQPSVWGRHAHRASLACISLALAACADQGPTDPASAAGPLASAGHGPRTSVRRTDPIAERLPSTPGACLVASRTSDGRYVGRSGAVPVPQSAGLSSTRLIRFGYRGWAAGVPDPVRLAVCTIPDTPGARAHFARVFGGSAKDFAELRRFAADARVPGAETWRPDEVPAGIVDPASSYITDGVTASGGGEISPSLVACDPNAIVPEPGCEDQEPPPDPNEPPIGPPPAPNLSYDPATGSTNLDMDYSVLGYFCDARTYAPVKGVYTIFARHLVDCYAGWTVYSVTVNGNIQRRMSILGWPWWSTVGRAPTQERSGLGVVETTTVISCNRSGRYRSNTFTKVSRGVGFDNYSSPGPESSIQCAPAN